MLKLLLKENQFLEPNMLISLEEKAQAILEMASRPNMELSDEINDE